MDVSMVTKKSTLIRAHRLEESPSVLTSASLMFSDIVRNRGNIRYVLGDNDVEVTYSGKASVVVVDLCRHHKSLCRNSEELEKELSKYRYEGRAGMVTHR